MGFKSKLSPKDVEKARAELNEDPKTRNDKIKELLTRCKEYGVLYIVYYRPYKLYSIIQYNIDYIRL